MTGRPTANR